MRSAIIWCQRSPFSMPEASAGLSTTWYFAVGQQSSEVLHPAPRPCTRPSYKPCILLCQGHYGYFCLKERVLFLQETKKKERNLGIVPKNVVLGRKTAEEWIIKTTSLVQSFPHIPRNPMPREETGSHPGSCQQARRGGAVAIVSFLESHI